MKKFTCSHEYKAHFGFLEAVARIGDSTRHVGAPMDNSSRNVEGIAAMVDEASTSDDIFRLVDLANGHFSSDANHVEKQDIKERARARLKLLVKLGRATVEQINRKLKEPIKDPNALPFGKRLFMSQETRALEQKLMNAINDLDQAVKSFNRVWGRVGRQADKQDDFSAVDVNMKLQRVIESIGR